MRLLTLAKEAIAREWAVCFATRNPTDSIIKLIQKSGHEVRILTSQDQQPAVEDNLLLHGDWLSVSQETDATETLQIIQEFNPDWIIVDHYAIDAKWHQLVKRQCKKILVIDDLADRTIDCTILLNQNLGAIQSEYQKYSLSDCVFLIGPDYALLRQEFRDWRKYSLNRRFTGKIKKILVTMGGVDASNHTLSALMELETSKYSLGCEFTVVVGSSYPYKAKLDEYIKASKLSIKVMMNVSNMAEIMANSDLCIGASGSSSWERCCLCLPTVTLVIAENQKKIALALHKNGVAVNSDISRLKSDFATFFVDNNSGFINKFVWNSTRVCDGFGVNRVIDKMEQLSEN